MRVVPVVCAVIEASDGRVLVAQRPAHKHLALKWEFAGGKIEAGESAAVALRREIGEELGCELELTGELPVVHHDYGDVRIEMVPFTAVLAPGSAPPHPHEHVALRWVTPTELRQLDLAPADWPVVDAWLARRSPGTA
jgi:8-oxo-dGTP diphosphatase